MGIEFKREQEYRNLVKEWSMESWPLNYAAEVLATVFMWLDEIRNELKEKE